MHSTAVIIIGGHRTGTSVTAQLIHRLGFPAAPSEDRLLRPRPGRIEDNPDGYWEDRAFVQLHRRMLSEHRRPIRWWNPRRDAREIERLSEGYQQLVRERATAPRWSLKDPRLCLLSDVLAAALRHDRVDFCVVTTTRSPEDVCDSLVRRGLAERSARLLADRFESARVEAIAKLASEGIAIHSVDYDALVSPDLTRATVEKLSAFLAVPCSIAADDVVKPRRNHPPGVHHQQVP